MYKNGALEFFNHPEGIVEKEADGYKYVYQFKDHLQNLRLSYSDRNKDRVITQDEIIQEKNYYPFGMTHSGYNSTLRGRNHNYGFNGKEEQSELGLEWHDFGARNYDGAIGRWMSPDPLSEEFSSWSPYNSMMNNPINLIDPDGRAAFSPIYDTGGNFLGTDDQGLQGKAIVMEAENFEQGMSHEDALSNNLGTEGLKDGAAGEKLIKNYNGLKDRPDYDGKITLSEANDWYRNGGGKPLFVDLSKVDLGFISSEQFKSVGSTKPIQTLFDSEDGAIYGNVTFTYEGENKVSAAPDVYDFGRHNRRSTASSPLTRIKENAKRGIRNAATVGGRIVADRSPFNLHNKEFKINFYGKGNISN
ncbi:RHS repeat domain-containing protein [Aquimarina macrocephali]|uniref:RHS repeat domain-containing protein n=1 Tax=Aquimarina macrocephali TaxID=666563 RepID=UPI000463DEAF|nr:RHS repeat-associated core domain-containing protein [Aquimarina macrocephali]